MLGAYKLWITLVLFAFGGYVVGGYSERLMLFKACKQYYNVLPEQEKPEVCSEVMGLQWRKK